MSDNAIEMICATVIICAFFATWAYVVSHTNEKD